MPLQRLFDDMVRLRNLAVPVKQRAERNAGILEVLTAEVLSDLEQRVAEASELAEISRKIDEIQPKQAAVARRVATSLKIAKVSFDGFDERLAELQVLSELYDRIRKAEGDHFRAAERADLSRQRVNEATERYEAEKAEVFSNAEGETTCPLCGSEIDEDLVEHILEGHPHA